MLRSDLLAAARLAGRPARLVALLALVAASAGCSKAQVRSQKEEETEKERYPVRTVGEVSTFGNGEPVIVSGVGIVEGLAGTGSPAPVGDMRQMVEHELRKQKHPGVNAFLNSTENSLVLVHAVIPPGAKKGDKLDLEISLPPGSRTTSLRGGHLRRCTLHNFDLAGRYSKSFAGSNATLRGHPLARGEGALLVGFSGGDESERLRKARIENGGVCLVDRVFNIVLNSNQQYAAVAANVANRVNAAFQGTVIMTPGTELAVARNNVVVTLNVPAQYRLNLPRFLRVVRMVPLEELPGKESKELQLPYREQIAEDLLDPARAVIAALRLEALGTDSIPTLKKGLDSPHPLVRFCAAESLAYLGSPACGEELGRVAREQPYLRAFALTAMASLDEAVCHVQLKELLTSDLDDETRYGAFRALRTLDETTPEVAGEQLNDTYWLHRVDPAGKPFVHVAASGRAEIVLFGEAPKLVPPLSLLAGEYAVTAAEGSRQCMVTHVPLNGDEGGPSRVPCSLDADAVIRTLAKAGASYPEVVEILRQADGCKSMTCRVRNDALPQVLTVEQLVAAGREQLGKESASRVQVIKPDASFGATPTLYQKATARRRGPLDEDARALQRDRKEKETPRTAERE
jgi:hypothetical protein